MSIWLTTAFSRRTRSTERPLAMTSMTPMTYAFLFCLGLAESIPTRKGYQDVVSSRDSRWTFIPEEDAPRARVGSGTGSPSHPVSPDFVLQLRVSDNATATLYAYKRSPSGHALLNGAQETVERETREEGEGNDGRIRHHLDFDQLINDQSFQLQQLRHHSVQPISEDYDGKGAMYFAIAVILFYGISIAMLVAASTLRRSHTDYELKGFLRSYARIDEERRSREKQKVRMVLQQKNLMHMLPGCSLAGNTTLLAGTVVNRQHPVHNPQQRIQQQQQQLKQRDDSAAPHLMEGQLSRQPLQHEQPRCKGQPEDDAVKEKRLGQRTVNRCLRVFYSVNNGATKTETEIPADEMPPEVDETGQSR